MTTPENKAGKLQVREVAAERPMRGMMRLLLFLDRLQDRRMMSAASRDAVAFREKAEKCTAAQPIKRGKNYFEAGKCFLSARQFEEARESLEAARPDLEFQKMQGTSAGFYQLGSLYQALECAYRLCGEHDKADETLVLAKELAQEQEEIFGLRTDFLGNGVTIISYSAGVSEPLESTA